MQTSKAAELVRGMLRIRRFEERCIRLAQEGKFPGHYHVYIGQEATAVAFDHSSLRWLKISDLIAEPEGPSFISRTVANRRLDRRSS